MRTRVGSIGWAAVAATLWWSAPWAQADARLDLVVAKVGTATITVEDVERRLAAVPDFQRATFGTTDRDIVKRFVEQVMVRDVLLAEGARARRIDETSPVRERIVQALRNARVEGLRRQVRVKPEEVAAFFAEHRARFEAPERIGVYRILCATREQAEAVLADVKAASGLTRWTELARERSIDKATQYRGGNLGFLAADGTSNEVSVRVDPKLFAAAKGVRDGELVPEPVQEGEAYAVVWRRGSMPPVHRSVEEESSAIRQVLERQAGERALASLVAELRRSRGVESHPDLIDTLEVDPFGEVVPARSRPASAPRGAHSAQLSPSATPRGLR